MKKGTYSVLMTFLCMGAIAAPVAQWSKDLATIVDLTDYNTTTIYPYEFQEFPDGSSAILLNNKTGPYPQLLIVLDANGDKIFSTTNTFNYGRFANYPATVRKFAILDGQSESGATIRFFEDISGSYTSTDRIALGIGIKNDYRSKALYTMSGTVLTKHMYADESPALAGSATGVENSNYIVSWKSQTDIQYQIQTAASLTSSWTSVGYPVTGTGSNLNWSTPVVSSSEFYRVIIQ